MNDLTNTGIAPSLIPIGTNPKSSLPPALSRDDDTTRALINNGREVSPEARAALRRHYDNLGRWLTGSDARDVSREVMRLFAGVKHVPSAGVPDDMIFAVWSEVLCEQPLWAISRAVRDFVTGKAGDGKFAPSVAEVNKLCQEKTARYREEHRRIGLVLGVEK